MQIPQFLGERGVAFETIYHPPAFTAQKRAKYLRISGQLVAKCVLLHGPEGLFLAVLPASRHVDTEALAEQLGGPVRLAEAEEIVERFRDCEWGVVAPFGTAYGLPTILDDSLPPEADIVFEGNTHAVAIRLPCRDFERIERPRRLAFAR